MAVGTRHKKKQNIPKAATNIINSGTEVSTDMNFFNELEKIKDELANISLQLINTKIDKANIQKKIKDIVKENEILHDHIYYLEKDLNQLNQYSRRENLEITGISEDIGQDDLEDHVINFLENLGVEVQHYNIAAVHRLKN